MVFITECVQSLRRGKLRKETPDLKWASPA